MAAWTGGINDDGLLVKFGTGEATVGIAGEVNSMNNEHIVELELTATSLADASAIFSQHTVIPSGAFIRRVEVQTEVAVTSGGAATLNVGLNKLDRTTAIDADGLVAALALASFNAAGETVLLTTGATGAGALIGTVLAFPGILVADFDTAAFTAGKVIIRIVWYMP